YSEGDSPAGRMEAGAKRWMRLISEEPHYFPLFIEVWRAAQQDPKIKRRLRTAYRNLIRELVTLMSADAPTVSATLDQEAISHFALIVCSLADGLALHKILDPDRVPDDLLGGFLRAVVDAASLPPGC